MARLGREELQGKDSEKRMIARKEENDSEERK